MLIFFLMIVWFTLPIMSWFANLCFDKRIHPVLLYPLAAIVGYLILVSSVWMADAQLTAEMNQYDLDGDGGIGGDELTPEAERAIDEWASDTGRTMAPFLGVPLTAIWYGILFAFLFGGEWIIRKVFMSEPTSPPPSPIPDSFSTTDTKQPAEDGNPYRPPFTKS